MESKRWPGKSLSPWNTLRLLYRADAGEPLPALLAEYKISRTTFFRWRSMWGHEAWHGMETPELTRFREIRESLAEAQDILNNAMDSIDLPFKMPRLDPLKRRARLGILPRS